MADVHSSPSAVSLCQKYGILQPTFQEDDLGVLKHLMQKELEIHKEWRSAWLATPALIRFLRAFVRVEDAHKAIVKYCNWRIEFKVDDISPNDPDVLREALVQRSIIPCDQRDRCHRPIIICLPRNHNKHACDLPSVTKATIYQLEHLCAMCDEKIIDSLCVIFDMFQFSMQNMDYYYMKEVVWLLQNCYPERLGVCLVVNAPWIFWGCWQIIKHWLNEVTRSKVIFVSSYEQLSEFVNVDQLPVKFFGNDVVSEDKPFPSFPSPVAAVTGHEEAGSSRDDQHLKTKKHKKRKQKNKPKH